MKVQFFPGEAAIKPIFSVLVFALFFLAVEIDKKLVEKNLVHLVHPQTEFTDKS